MNESTSDLTGKPARNDGAHRGRRISWAEFERLTGRKRPPGAADKAKGAASATQGPADHGPHAPSNFLYGQNDKKKLDASRVDETARGAFYDYSRAGNAAKPKIQIRNSAHAYCRRGRRGG